MEGESCVQVICDLFSKCNLQEQQILLNELLPLFLKRDFLALVPFAVRPIILQFLTLADIFSCLLVSKAWNRTINECTSYWSRICRINGMSRFISESTSLYPLVKQLASTGVKYQSLLKSYHAEHNIALPLHGSYLMLPIGCWLPNQQEFFLALSTGNVSIMEVYAEIDVNNVLCSTAVDPSFRLLWHSSSPTLKQVTWLGNDGVFHKWSLNSDLSTWTLSHLNHRIISLADYSISCCSECSLICVATKYSQDNNSLIQLLYWDTQSASVAQHSIQFLPDERLRNDPLFRLYAANIKPISTEPKPNRKCTQHYIFFQFGSTIAVYKCDDTIVLKQILSSADDIQTASVLGLSHKFQVSSNGEMIGIILNGLFHQWSLSNSGVFIKKSVDITHIGSFSANANCLAIGRMFSIIAGSNKLVVVVTETGAVLIDYHISRSHGFVLLPPYNQLWLNDLLLLTKKFELSHVMSVTGIAMPTMSLTLTK